MASKQLTRFLVAVLMTAAFVAPATAQNGPKIAPRDLLTIVVFGVDALSGKYPVSTEGTITFPHIGQVRVAGREPRDVETTLAAKLKDGGYLVNPQVTVELQQTPNKKVIITGAVRSPGQHAFAGEITLFEALALAGSTTADAGDLALVIRAGSNSGDGESPGRAEGEGVIEVSLSELENGNLAEHNVSIHDGDHVVIPRAQQVFISGQVRSPGAYSIPTGTTVLQALTLAGGLTERGTMRGLRIIREKKEVKNVKADTVVKPGDTIIVKASPF